MGRFFIQNDVAEGKPGYRAHEIREAKGKIIAALRIETDGAIAFVQLAAPTIELDLMQPAKADRRTDFQGWNAGFDEGEATQESSIIGA